MDWAYRLLRAALRLEIRTAIAVAAFGDLWADWALRRAGNDAANLPENNVECEPFHVAGEDR